MVGLVATHTPTLVVGVADVLPLVVLGLFAVQESVATAGAPSTLPRTTLGSFVAPVVTATKAVAVLAPTDVVGVTATQAVVAAFGRPAKFADVSGSFPIQAWTAMLGVTLTATTTKVGAFALQTC